MPMLAFVGHLALIHANCLPTGITVFSEHTIETGQTIRPAFSHDVTLATELSVALKASKMGHMPSPSFGFSAFVRQDDLKIKKESISRANKIISCIVVHNGPKNLKKSRPKKS